jgi:hypothetical protein
VSGYYIDTCSLQWRYLEGKASIVIDGILDDANNNVYSAELTILEWSSALARALRRGAIDQEQFKKYEIALMTDIFNDKLIILPTPTRLIERARYLIEYIGVKNKLRLGSGDAIHLVNAFDAINKKNTKLEFLTNDKALANIISTIDIFKEEMSVQYLSTE